MSGRTRIVGMFTAMAFIFAGVVAVDALAGKKKPPAKKITIDGCKKKKPPVVFDHPGHVKRMKKDGEKCVSCHHLVDKKEAKKDKCSDCHTKKTGDKIGLCSDKSKKANPFHVKCIGCHKEKKSDKAPTKCKDCHKK